MRLLFLNFLIASISSFSFSNNIALPCYGCHVSKVIPNNSIPSIIGLDKKYFIAAFNEYKNKVRDNYLMHIISQGYTNEQVKLLADYFSKKNNIND